jgi:hypothetical protein
MNLFKFAWSPCGDPPDLGVTAARVKRPGITTCRHELQETGNVARVTVIQSDHINLLDIGVKSKCDQDHAPARERVHGFWRMLGRRRSSMARLYLCLVRQARPSRRILAVRG